MNKLIIPKSNYLLPFVMVLFQFCFLFVALFGSGFDFEKRVLIIAFIFVCLWGVLSVADYIKEKNYGINSFNIFLVILFSLFCFNLIRQSWFVNYLRIDAIQRFFSGKTFIDTLYHSAIAESIVTNGYPVASQNAPVFLSYHCLSHYFIAVISKILTIPCFVTYNYLFPVLFIPLLLFLVQKVAVIGKAYLSGVTELRFIDYIILLGLICGFVTKHQQANLGCNIYIALFNSESCLMAVTLLLLYFCIIDKGYRKKIGFDNYNLFIIIPIFILLLSFTKISFGIIFTLGASYYVFRKYLLKDKRFFLFVLYCGIFIFYFFLINHFSYVYSGPGVEIQKKIILFHYVQTKCRNLFYIIFHYLFLFFPVVSTIIISKDKIFEDILSYKKEGIFLEMNFLLMIGACLPGIFMNIHGGSAFYFVIPVYFFSWILLTSYNVANILIKKHIKLGQICFVLMIILVFLTCSRDMKAFNSIHQTLNARIAIPKTLKDKEYLTFNQIWLNISKNRKDFCVFLSDDSEMISRFDDALKDSSPKVYYCRPYLATSAYLGLPVINSIYEKDGYFYRGDDKAYGRYKGFAGPYAMPPADCGEKVTEENMIARAKAFGKKYIIVLKHNNYYVAKVNI